MHVEAPHSRRATITVLLADDQRVCREALAAMVEREPTLDLAAVAEDAEQALALARRLCPDVAIVDVRMGGGGGVRVARELRERGSLTRVLALSAYDDDELVAEMLHAGAVGYLIKSDPMSAVIDAIHAVARGVRAFSPEMAPSLRSSGEREPGDSI
jgi:DNA-binding NarL/FixJ family response regulator